MQIEMKNICKSFGGNPVLKDAQFSLQDGEIHALMGENGAGKSTLMNILTGVYSKDSGTVLVNGKQVLFKNPQEAEQYGIVFIHQELNVLPDLTVEENLFIGKEIHKTLGICCKKEMRRLAIDALEKLGVAISPTEIISNLSVGQQQMVEICKALMVDAKVIVMDEPTAALTQNETDILFDVVRNLKKRGVSIIYISHRMEEIFELCDRVSVLRDGCYIGTNLVCETNMNEIVKMMIGREIGERFPKRDSSIGQEILRVEELTKNGVFKNISFSLHEGEVLGISGLMGAGRTEIMQAIFGNLPYDSGTTYVYGSAVKIKSPKHAMELGMGYITEDRKNEGILLNDTIRKNTALVNLKKICNIGMVINKKSETDLVNHAIEELLIKCFGAEHICANLSGGNQQKVVFAKWVYTNPKILILDEPTRGVDVGAKKEIYNIINKLASSGVGIIMVSSELPEVIGMSDKILVIHEGVAEGILDKELATQESVMTLATGGSCSC